MIDNRLYWGRYLVLGFFGGIAVPSAVSAEPTRVFAGKTLHELSEFLGIPVRDLEELTNFERVADKNLIQNQEFSRPFVQAAGVNSSSGVQTGLMTYRVRRGDTLYGIARKGGVTLPQIIRANPQIANPDLIFPGQIVWVPKGMKVANKSNKSKSGVVGLERVRSSPVTSSSVPKLPQNVSSTSQFRERGVTFALPVNPAEITGVNFVQRPSSSVSNVVKADQTVAFGEKLLPSGREGAKSLSSGLPDSVFQPKGRDLSKSLFPSTPLASLGSQVAGGRGEQMKSLEPTGFSGFQVLLKDEKSQTFFTTIDIFSLFEKTTQFSFREISNFSPFLFGLQDSFMKDFAFSRLYYRVSVDPDGRLVRVDGQEHYSYPFTKYVDLLKEYSLDSIVFVKLDDLHNDVREGLIKRQAQVIALPNGSLYIPYPMSKVLDILLPDKVPEFVTVSPSKFIQFSFSKKQN